MKKAMSIVFAALMVAGMTTVYAGECGGCPSQKAEQASECPAQNTVACSAEKSGCPAQAEAEAAQAA